ncbi:serine/threonine-protein kinase LMTK2 [Denticeps clupeoides]|uniref:serine/threonine-protein kinase LMTK2 n=1 Tax=Denticeps clupeoides TaxID=299321 RepID=UPI0010A31266|nr:serine/threonine-protein kinase LMTK2 [Denticeps clupeoides]
MGRPAASLFVLGLYCLLRAAGPGQAAPLPSSAADVGADLSLSLGMAVGISVGVFLALVVLLLNCVTCCKEQEINFKEFEDNFEDEVDFTPPAEDTPSMLSPAEVYTVAVTHVALPGPSHLRMSDALCSSHVARQTLSYIQEIGNGWFGKVLLSEIYTNPGAAKVVVKELKANAGAKEQNEFLLQADPFRVLQHPNLLRCVGQCVEAIPFLLVYEFCELGDLRSHLAMMGEKADLLLLQKMACEIAAGVTHLHKHNFLHSDLALRNCFLTADLTVKVGDYGIGPNRYKEDYVTTEDEQLVPLRWLAPELVSNLHGGINTAEQTKPGNVWALGITLWELFENGNQPYPHLSDKEVLNHVIRDQQIKLFKPQLDLPYSERWYEVLQFCWLPADKRATAEEVHRLLTYLRMQGQKDVEDDFEQRWNMLRPNTTAHQTTVSHSSFPILEQFDDGFESNEVLTVTETSRGLSFEYVWGEAKQDYYDKHIQTAVESTLNYQNMFFPVPSQDILSHFPEPAAATDFEMDTPSAQTLTVFEAHKLPSGDEGYIQLDEQGESSTDYLEVEVSKLPAPNQQFVVLQDIRLEDSSTDADFFNQSMDSKDSFLPDSLVWSSTDQDSPYHTNIFSDADCKIDDQLSWRAGFVELPERSSCSSFQRVEIDSDCNVVENSQGQSFQPGRSENDGPDVTKFLNSEKLADNIQFLKDRWLMKDSPILAKHDASSALSSLDSENAPLDDPISIATKELSKYDLEHFAQPFQGNQTQVPLQSPVSGENSSHHLSSGGFEAAVISFLDSTSQSAITAIGPTHSLPIPVLFESATTDDLCPDANNSNLERFFDSDAQNPHCTTADGIPHSTLLISDICLDQISQDSLLDDSFVSSLPTIENSAETPDSLDSLDVHRLEGEQETLKAIAPIKLEPPYKTADSGYETENLESPEWNLQPVVKETMSKENGMSNFTARGPPDILVSEFCGAEMAMKLQQPSASEQDGCPIASYRDSAYFSDNETEPYKKDSGERSSADSHICPMATEPVVPDVLEDVAHTHWGPANCIQDLSVKGRSESDSKSVVIKEVHGENQVSSIPTVKENCSEASSLQSVGPEALESSADVANLKTYAETMVHAKLSRTYAAEGSKLKEPDMEGKYLGKFGGDSLVDFPDDDMDANEESEISDDSDEERHPYRLNSSSSDSEDDTVHPVPLIISDNSNMGHLKSLLKATLLPMHKPPSPGGSDSESSRKAVSFFDDVTVYLFDQETPTKELGDHTLGSNSQVSEFSNQIPSSSYLNHFTNSTESSTDEEGGGFEWDDDFSSPEPSFLSKTKNDLVKTSPSVASQYFSPSPQQSWIAPSTYSRFAINPSIASFSLTHLTDSDIEQGGSSEDGEKD